MKIRFLLVLSALVFATTSSMADTTLTLTGVHNCCQGCTTGILKSVAEVDGASATADDETVVITARSEADAKKAVASLLNAGYYGAGAEAPGVQDAKVKTITVSGVHLCCGKCVKAVEKAVKATGGTTTHTAVKGSKTFIVEGDFSTAELATALNKEGLNGKLN